MLRNNCGAARLALAVGTVTASALVPAAARAAQHTGTSSTDAPYLVPASGGPALDVYSILTVKDTVGAGASAYQMVGIPDGLGAYDNGDGTFTLLMNHEFGSGTTGATHAHGGKGSFVSRWVISAPKNPDGTANVADPNWLKVQSGRDLDDSVVTTTTGAGGALNAFARFCSSDLAPVSAYYNAASGNGTQKRILLNGEESGTASRGMAHVVDVGGPNTAVGYQLNAFNGLGSWENFLAHPNQNNVLGDKTVVLANDDGGFNKVYAYTGTKQSTGLDVDKAGLTNGTVGAIQVKVNGVNVAAESRTLGLASTGTTAVYNGTFGYAASSSGTVFLRPEDGAWDPTDPNVYYFVTTDRNDDVKDGVGTQVGRTRLWRMIYSDITNPSAGGTIDALLDGTEPIQMLDNITAVKGVDGRTRIIAQEDIGNNAHNGKLWLYDTATDGLSILGKHFALNGDIGTAATSPFNADEEFSGIIDARDVLGLGWFLTSDQQHSTSGQTTTTVEGGQLIAFYAPEAIPEPSALAMLTVPAVAALRRRRR